MFTKPYPPLRPALTTFGDHRHPHRRMGWNMNWLLRAFVLLAIAVVVWFVASTLVEAERERLALQPRLGARRLSRAATSVSPVLGSVTRPAAGA